MVTLAAVSVMLITNCWAGVYQSFKYSVNDGTHSRVGVSVIFANGFDQPIAEILSLATWEM
jgi:hypothetical protein